MNSMVLTKKSIFALKKQWHPSTISVSTCRCVCLSSVRKLLYDLLFRSTHNFSCGIRSCYEDVRAFDTGNMARQKSNNVLAQCKRFWVSFLSWVHAVCVRVRVSLFFVFFLSSISTTKIECMKYLWNHCDSALLPLWILLGFSSPFCSTHHCYRCFCSLFFSFYLRIY